MFFKKTFQTRACIAITALLFLPYFFNLFYKGGIGLLNHLIFFLCAGLAGLIFYFAIQKKIYSERHLPFYENFSLVAFVSLFSISYLNSVTKNVGLLELGSVFAGVILIIIGYNAAKSSDHIKRLFLITTLSSLFSLIIGFAVYFTGSFERFAGTFNNYLEPWSAFPNAFGDFLLLTIPLTFYLIEQKKKKDPNLLAYLPEFTFIISAAAIVLINSQGIQIAAIILFALLLARLTITGKFAKKLIILTIVGIVIGLGTSGLKQAMMFDYRNDVDVSGQGTIDAKKYEQENSVNTRMDHFKVGFDLMLSAPLFGFGPGSYPYISASKLTLLNTAEHPHNIFLKIGVENGILTLISFIVLISTILIRALLMFLQKLDPAREVVFLGIVSFLAHQMIDYNLNFTSIQFLFYILLGTLIIERLRKTKPVHIKEFRFVNHFMLVAFGLVLIGFSINDGLYHLKAVRADDLGQAFTYQGETLLKRSYYEDYASYLQTIGIQSEKVIQDGLALNPYNDSLYALNGNFQEAYKLNPHNLYYLLGLYENALSGHRAVLETEIRNVLTEYEFLLSTNTNFTILTENPIMAVSLARLISDNSLAELLQQSMNIEKDKFEKLYNISL